MASLTDVGSEITFQNFCDVCEKIKNANAKRKSELMQDFFNRCRNNGNANLYSVLRLLLPTAERERGSYGIKEATFAKLYIRILNLPKRGIDALKLTNYKAPSASSSLDADFANIAFFVLKSRCKPSTQVFSLEDINRHLDNISNFQSNNSQRNIEDELTKLTTSMPVNQQKWFIRIILKNLRLGLGQNKILSCFHPDAPDLFDSSSGLEKVCTVLYSPNIHLHEIEVEMYSAFRPMLSEKLDIAKINDAMKRAETYFIETKFDGERFQIHMKNGVFKYFSRNGYDYTEQYGESYSSEEGMLTKFLKNAIDPSVDSFIIDGEMMGWHKSRKVFSSKGVNFDVKKIGDQSSHRPCFCAFDILLLNEAILTNKPLRERLKYLDDLFCDEEGVIMHSKRVEVRDGDKVLEALNNAIDNQEEGIVIKQTDSLYKPNSRKAGWYKIKPEYTDGVMNELDLLIIGGYYAENKRYGMIGSVLLGVADSSIKIDNVPTTFHACGKVKLTLVREELEELSMKLQPFWNTVQKDTNLSSILWTKDKPDVWIEPKNSFIVQVKASELVRSNQFKTDFTLRFPRVERVRYDKPWYDCLTCEEFAKLTENAHSVEKLTSRKVTTDDLATGEVSPRKKTCTVSDRFRSVASNDVREISTLLCGKEICVISGTDEVSKSDLELKVLENGGRIVQNPQKNTFCIIAGDTNARIANLVKSGEFNIATVDWFLRTLDDKCLSDGKLLEWTPRDLIGCSKETAEEFLFKFDEFGDSYTMPTTIDSLKYSLKKAMESEPTIKLLPSELKMMDNLLFNGPSPFSFLRNCVIYLFDDDESSLDQIKFDLELTKAKVQLYGGDWASEMNSETTHVLLGAFDRETIKVVAKKIADSTCSAEILSIDWLNESLEKNCLLDTSEHVINIEKYL